MTTETIYINDLKEYIAAAFRDDYEIVFNFDPKYLVQTTEHAIDIVFQKIETDYSECYMKGLKNGNNKIGYMVYENDLLISFGINPNYRNASCLIEFWAGIKSTLGDNFQCVLFSNNKRGIAWLNKCGMKIVCESVTILQTTKS